jgi:hypothetical protein
LTSFYLPIQDQAGQRVWASNSDARWNASWSFHFSGRGVSQNETATRISKNLQIDCGLLKHPASNPAT